MDEKPHVDAVPEQHGSPQPALAAPGLSAELTAAHDPSTSVEDASAARPPATDADQHAPAPDGSLSFLQPGKRPDSLGRLGHYEVLEVLGKGGFGIVLRAFDENLERPVAIKVLSPHLAGNAAARVRFVREARAAAAVNSKHVVSTYEVYERPIPHLVMEHVAGKSLQDRIDRMGPLQTRDVLRIGAEIAAGLAAAHQRGLIHRDIKPANILLEEKPEGERRKDEGSPGGGPTSSFAPRPSSFPRVKIADFGLARAVDDASLTQSGVITGTPHYMSPEQARGDELDHRSDLFSLGSVLYTMCTGQPPFRAHKTLGVLKRVCDDAPQPIRATNPAIPDALAAVVNLLLVKDPAGRFQTAAAVAELLSQHLAHLDDPSLPAPAIVCVGGETTDQPNTVSPPARKPWSRRRKLALGVAGACVLPAVVVGLLPLLRSPDPSPRPPDPSGPDAPAGQPDVALDPRLPAVLRGEKQPADNAERLAFARLAYDRKHFAAAARLWAEAFAGDPKLADDPQAQHRYHAARAAALAADGQGQDEPPPDDAARARLRWQALDWQKAELIARGKRLESAPPQDRLAIEMTLSGWKQDGALAGIRSAAALAGLRAEEQKAFARLWAAAGDPETFLGLQSGAPNLLKTAAVQAWFGQGDALAATRSRVLRFAKDTNDPTTAERSAKICCLSPADEKTNEAALVLARRAVELGKGHGFLVYFQMCLGMAEYRCGHYAAADTALLEAAKLGGRNYYVSRTTPFYQAMSLFRQGREAEARKRLADAVAQMRPLPADEKNLRIDSVNADDLIMWLACKEARALLSAPREPRLPAVLRGEDHPADNAERLAFARIAYDQKLFAAAARLWAEALAGEPKLADDRQAQHRYNAACAAALAAAGQGQDEPPPDDAARAKLRRQALDWLRAELAAWGKLLESTPPQARPTVRQTLSHWQKDADLAGVRDQAALDKLSAEERKAFAQLWSDVAELLKKA
jgi:serine/threonine protein kinase